MSLLQLDQSWDAGDCKVRVIVTGNGPLVGIWDDIQRLCAAAQDFAARRPAPSQERGADDV